jgi:hypothetical protein
MTVTNGSPDGNNHPYVGIALQPAPGGGFFWCLGCGSGLQGFDSHDVAVITLNAAVALPAYAVLPTVGLVDTLDMKSDVDIVGYGVQDSSGAAASRNRSSPPSATSPRVS